MPPCDRRESYHDHPSRAGHAPAPPRPVSRRARHGRNPHQHPSARPARPGTPSVERDQAPADARSASTVEIAASAPAVTAAPIVAAAVVSPAVVSPAVVSPAVVSPAVVVAEAAVVSPAAAPVALPEPRPAREPVHAPAPAAAPQPAHLQPAQGDNGDYRTPCTQAQLRRFIKSRPWVPMHELRRRFGINGGDDDVSPIRVGGHTLFIGLPPSEGRMMGELLNAGDVGCELSLDPVTPVVIGVYPMRPVPRS